MRSAIIIVGGLVLLGVCLLAARWLGASAATAAKAFIALWLVIALINMYVGVARAGYTVAEELPIFLAIFAIPSIAAAVAWWKMP